MFFADNRSVPETAQPINGTGRHECRVWPRFPSDLEIACQPVAARDEEDPVWTGRIRDVSVGGVGLLLSRRFERGTGLAIEVAATESAPGETYLAKVVHVGKHENGVWLHGCEFISKLSDDEVRRLLDSSRPAEKVVPEKPNGRAAQRHRVSLRAAWRRTGANEPASACAIQDISSLGLALILPAPVAINSLLDIELLRPGENTGPTVQARVVNVHSDSETPETWIVGCAFVEELSAEDVLPLHAASQRSRLPDFSETFSCSIEVICHAGSGVTQERTQARVLNISPSAIGLLLPTSFPQGTVLRLELPDASHARTRFLVRVVVSLEHRSGCWFLGCEFVTQLQANDLQTLLR